MKKEFIYAGTEYIFHASTREEWDGMFTNSYSVQQKSREVVAMEHWDTKEHLYNLDVTPRWFLDNDYPNCAEYRIETEFGSREDGEARYNKIFDLVCKTGVFQDWEECQAYQTKDDVTQ